MQEWDVVKIGGLEMMDISILNRGPADYDVSGKV
jgi:hypothetical protein